LATVNTEKLKPLAKDLRKQPPPGPHEKLGGNRIAVRFEFEWDDDAGRRPALTTTRIGSSTTSAV